MKNRLECMQPIRFLVVLLMCCLSYTTWAQTQSNVNGLVTDFSGEPLIGVSILVKGTSNGTVTDLDGKFSLSAEMGNMLQISYVGYISQEIKVESNKLLRIIMEEDTKKLEEVVVVGYGTQKKVNLTGAVSAVSAEDLASKPVMSTAQALAGLASRHFRRRAKNWLPLCLQRTICWTKSMRRPLPFLPTTSAGIRRVHSLV